MSTGNGQERRGPIPERTVTVGEHLRRNTRSSMVCFILGQALKFLLVPIVVAQIGEAYALVRVAFIFFGYLSIYEFGINTAYVKYTAECHAKRDYARLSRLLSTGTVLCMVVSVVTLAGVLAFLDDIARFFEDDPAYFGLTKFVLGYVAVIAMLNVTMGSFRAAMTGIQRIDVMNACRIGFQFFEFVMVIGLLWMGLGVRMVVVFYGITTVGPLLFIAFLVRKHLPDLRINPLWVSRDALRPLFTLGGRMQLLGILALLVAGLDQLVLWRYEALALTTAYMLARGLVMRVQLVPMQGFGPLIPASADLVSRGETEKAGAVFASALRLTGVVTAYFFAFTAINADLIFVGYVGELEYATSGSRALMLLSVSAIIHTCTGPGSSMLRGAGKPLLESLFHVATLSIFGVMFYIGQRTQDEQLIVLAFPAAITVASALFVLATNRYFKAPLLCPFNSIWPQIVAGFGGAWGLRMLLRVLPVGEITSRWEMVIAVCAMGVVYTGLFAVAAWFLPGLTVTDKDQVLRFIPYGKRVARALRLVP
ncbi:MAG: hypothetical protein GY851_14145 [bacterium]|nr:hypothetical protein [bacterium]